MDNPSANTSNEDFEPHNLPQLAPGESPTPLPRLGRVPTKISVTEVPIPRILTIPDTAPKREAMRKTEHAMNYHAVDEENDVMAQVDRIKQGLKGNQHMPVKVVQYPQLQVNPEEATFENLLVTLAFGAAAVAACYLIYKTFTGADLAKKALTSMGRRELKLAKLAAEAVVKELRK